MSAPYDRPAPSKYAGTETVTITYPVGPFSLPPRTARILFFSVLLLIFCVLERATFTQPYSGESIYVADTATLLAQNHLNPLAGGFNRADNLVLIPEVYAIGWLLLSQHYVWWPHLAALAFAFLALHYTFRLAGGSIKGMLCALLIAIDPLFRSGSSGISPAAPSAGLAAATLYHLWWGKPWLFAIFGSLTVLSYPPAAAFVFCLVGLAVVRHLVPIDWQDSSRKFAYCSLFGERRDWRAVLWFVLPAIVLAAWLLLCKWSHGYWLYSVRPASLDPHWLRDFLWAHGHFVFTVISVVGSVLLLAALLGLHQTYFGSSPRANTWYYYLGDQSSLLLLVVLLLGIWVYQLLFRAMSGSVAYRSASLIFIVPLFVLTTEYLDGIRRFFTRAFHMTRKQERWMELAWTLSFMLALAWNLRMHWQ